MQPNQLSFFRVVPTVQYKIIMIICSITSETITSYMDILHRLITKGVLSTADKSKSITPTDILDLDKLCSRSCDRLKLLDIAAIIQYAGN